VSPAWRFSKLYIQGTTAVAYTQFRAPQQLAVRDKRESLTGPPIQVARFVGGTKCEKLW
jgi:hypothetical protein